MSTHVQANYYLEATIAGQEFACQIGKLALTPTSRGKGKTEYPACPPAPGQDEAVIVTQGATEDGKATFDLWHDTTPTGITTALIQAQQTGELIDYVLVWRFDDATADYQWSGKADVDPITLDWDKSGDDRAHRGSVSLTLRTSVFGRPAAQPAA